MVSRGAIGSPEEVSGSVEYLSAHFGSGKAAETKSLSSGRPLIVDHAALKARITGQTDWQVFGHDPGASRYSPLAPIKADNGKALNVAWKFDTGERVRLSKRRHRC